MFNKIKKKINQYGLITALTATSVFSAQNAAAESNLPDNKDKVKNKIEINKNNKLAKDKILQNKENLINFEKAKDTMNLGFSPVEKPEFMTQQMYDDANILLSKMETFIAKGGKAERLYSDVGSMMVMVPKTIAKNNLSIIFKDYICNTILANQDYFNASIKELNISKHASRNSNNDKIEKKLRNYIQTPYKIINSDYKAKIALEYTCGKTTTATGANRTIEENAIEVAKLYDGLYKAHAYNLPEGKTILKEVDIKKQDDISWGAYTHGFNKNLVPELYCKATLEYQNEAEKNDKIATNLKLAYNRTEEFNNLIANQMEKLGNEDLAKLFNKRALDYKTKATSMASQINNVKNTPNAEYKFSRNDIKNLLTPGDKDKNNPRVSIFEIPIANTRSASNNLVSEKNETIYMSLVKDGKYETNHYNQDYKDHCDRYNKHVKAHVIKILKWQNSDEQIINKEITRISTQINDDNQAYKTPVKSNSVIR